MSLAALAPRPPPIAPDPGVIPPRHEIGELVRRAQDGEVRAFEQLIAQHQRRLMSFALSFTEDLDEAADLCQEALVKVYLAIGSFRFQSSFSTWLFRIVRNTFLDAVKSRAAKERRLQTPIEGQLERLAEVALAEDRLLRAEDRAALYRALAEVTEVYRTVVVLFDVEGLAYDEIAGVLNVPVGTVKSRLKRGRDALRCELFRAAGKEARRS